MTSQADGSSFSLTEGGPVYRLLRRLRIRTPDNNWVHAWLFAIAIWLPLVIGEGVRVGSGSPVDRIFLDLSMHVRCLFAIPMLLMAEGLLESTSRSSITSLYVGKFCDHAQLDRIFARVERLRDLGTVEVVLLGLALLGGQLVMWGLFGATGLFHGGAQSWLWTFPRLWYAVVALPLFQFLLFRHLWRWLIWSYALARISRLPLAPLATHADGAGGLACLARPVNGFNGAVLASSAVLSGAWATQILRQRAMLSDLLPELVAFLLISLLMAVGPLLPFCGHLFRARRRGLARYGDFMREYTLRFHAKWIEASPDHRQPLGSPDIQSLQDLGRTYQMLSKTRVFVFSPRTLMTVWAVGFLPMVPLLATTWTTEELLRRIAETVLGGLPL